jgi:CTP:molybdopterin cytidylyltransferase MocA
MYAVRMKQIRRLCAGLSAERADARVVYNPDFATGMYSSIKTGVRHLANESDGFFLLQDCIP